MYLHVPSKYNDDTARCWCCIHILTSRGLGIRKYPPLFTESSASCGSRARSLIYKWKFISAVSYFSTLPSANNYPSLIKPESLLPCSQKPATRPYRYPEKSRQHCFLIDTSIIFPSTPRTPRFQFRFPHRNVCIFYSLYVLLSQLSFPPVCSYTIVFDD